MYNAIHLTQLHSKITINKFVSSPNFAPAI